MAGAIATNELERVVDVVWCLGTAATVVEVVDACRERRLEMMVGVSEMMKGGIELYSMYAVLFDADLDPML